jgi:hypothetical protein
MERPYKYTIICRKTNSIKETNIEPRFHELLTWEETEDPKIRIKKQTKVVYVDTKYKAKLRLYNYITFTKQGLEIPIYEPFTGTEIGKSLPILNF